MGAHGKHIAIASIVALASVAGVACNKQAPAATQPAYSGVTRSLAITAAPVLVHEQSSTFDFLKGAFAKKGILEGKEVWGFAPNALTVYRGDTLDIAVVNPGDDPHSFTIPELSLDAKVKENGVSKVTFTATKTGIYRFSCTIAEHAPYMWGTLVVLDAPSA